MFGVQEKGMFVTDQTWLPPLVLFDDYNRDWNEYLEGMYEFYKKDFILDRPLFQNKKLSVKRHPIKDGKEITFWHVIQEGVGDDEDDRVPEFRRCERIRWPKPVIEHFESEGIKIWEKKHKGETRICIWYEKCEYIVIIAKRKGYNLFWTAYPVFRGHTKRKFCKEYKRYKQAGAANH